jgi:hypothetical protein
MKRSTLVLLGIVLVAVAVIALWERKRPGTDEAKAREGKLFGDLPKAEAFTRLERAGELPLTLVKVGDAWSIEAPVRDAADGFGVEGFVDRLREGRVTRFLEAPVPWKDLGLDPPRAVWTLRTVGEVFTVSLGGTAGLGEGVYLRVGDRAALVPQDIEGTLLRPPEEFRSRDLIPPGSGKVVSFRISRPGSPAVRGSKAGEDWTLAEPFADDADAGRVESLLDDVTFARAASFVEPNPESDFGLSAPRAEVVLSTDKGKTITVRLGADAPSGEGADEAGVKEERVYASVAGRPSILVVPAKVLRSLAASPDALRATTLFRHPPYEAEELRVEGAYALRLKRNDAGAWAIAGSEPKPGDATAGSAAGALTALEGVVAQPLGPEVPSPEAFVTLVLKGKGFEERVLIGPERDGRRYAYPKARPVALLLERDVWARAEAALKAVPLAPAPPNK